MRGIVMDAHGKKAAVLLEDGTFRTVRGKHAVGDTIEYHAANAHPVLRRAAAAAAVLALGAGGGIWYDSNFVAYGEISLDANPSIIYTVSKCSRVLEVRAGSENASAAVDTLINEGIRFMPVSDAIEMTIGVLGTEGYMDTENTDCVSVSISADGDMIQSRLTGAVEEGIGRARENNPSMEFSIDHAGRDTGRRAAEDNMSPERDAAREQAGSGGVPEACSEIPACEIIMEKPEETSEAAPGEFHAPEASPPPLQSGQASGRPEETATEAPEEPITAAESPPAPQFSNEIPPEIPVQGEKPDRQDAGHTPSEGMPPGSGADSGDSRESRNQPEQNGKDQPDPFRPVQPANGTAGGEPGTPMPERPSGRPGM